MPRKRIAARLDASPQPVSEGEVAEKRLVDIAPPPHGLGAGVNEYFLDTLAKNAIPRPINACTDWEGEKVLKILRGRVCWWAKLTNPDITIHGDQSVTGGLDVDLGAALEMCMKVIKNCKTEWKCGRYGLKVIGNVGLEVKLIDRRDRFAFIFNLDISGLDLEPVGIPDPFGLLKKLMKLVSSLFFRALTTVLREVTKRITWEILPPDIEFDGHNTKLRLDQFDYHNYWRDNNPSVSRNKFLLASVRPKAVR